MNKTLKIITILLMTMMIVFCTNTQMVFANEFEVPTKADAIKQQQEEGKKDNTSSSNIALDILDDIKPEEAVTTKDAKDATSELVKLANKVIVLIQIASAVAAVVLVAIFGFKFILGSANEKADYQKSFIPLIVGIVVVFATTSIARLLFGLIG